MTSSPSPEPCDPPTMTAPRRAWGFREVALAAGLAVALLFATGAAATPAQAAEGPARCYIVDDVIQWRCKKRFYNGKTVSAQTTPTTYATFNLSFDDEVDYPLTHPDEDYHVEGEGKATTNTTAFTVKMSLTNSIIFEGFGVSGAITAKATTDLPPAIGYDRAVITTRDLPLKKLSDNYSVKFRSHAGTADPTSVRHDASASLVVGAYSTTVGTQGRAAFTPEA